MSFVPSYLGWSKLCILVNPWFFFVDPILISSIPSSMIIWYYFRHRIIYHVFRLKILWYHYIWAIEYPVQIQRTQHDILNLTFTGTFTYYLYKRTIHSMSSYRDNTFLVQIFDKSLIAGCKIRRNLLKFKLHNQRIGVCHILQCNIFYRRL